MLTGAAAIDQAIFEAMRGVDYMRPAIVRPYIEFGELPSAEKTLKAYFQDKSIEKKLSQSIKLIKEQEDRLSKFLELNESMQITLGKSFADNKDKIEQRHLDNLDKWIADLERAAHETSAEETCLLKKLGKTCKLLAREKPKYKKGLREVCERIFAVGDAKTEAVYNMALFLRALRAEYSEANEQSAYFDNSEGMLLYLKGLAA